MDADDIVTRIVGLFEPVHQAEHALALADYQKARTDPWVWYCRKCGSRGSADTEEQRNLDGNQHVMDCSMGCGAIRAMDEHGHLRHVWSYNCIQG